MLRAQRIYEQYTNGDHITDDDLDYGIGFFKTITQELWSIGPVFKLSADETRRIWYALESFKEARKKKP